MAGRGRARGPFWPPGAGASRRNRIVFPQWGQTAQGVAGGEQRPRRFQRQRLAAQADCGLEACSGLAIVFSLAFWRAPYYLFLFPLFYFYFQVAGRTGCRPFTPLPWSSARRRPEPAQAQPHRPPGRRRLPGRAGAQPGRGTRGCWRIGGLGAKQSGRVEAGRG